MVYGDGLIVVYRYSPRDRLGGISARIGLFVVRKEMTVIAHGPPHATTLVSMISIESLQKKSFPKP
jgi:hypothetical protein